MADSINAKRIFLKLERVNESEVKLEFDFERDDEKNVYIMGIASTPDVNSAGFIMENKAIIDAWLDCKKSGKNIAVYEKHDMPIGKVVACEEWNDKVLVVMEIPKSGNERFLSVYELGIYVGLSVGGWTLDGEWKMSGDQEIFHVTEFEWYEVSITDIPANENALLLEFANTKKPQKVEGEGKQEGNNGITDVEIGIALENITKKIRGIN